MIAPDIDANVKRSTAFAPSRRALVGAGALALFLPARARAELRFDLKAGEFVPFPIAIADFVGAGEEGGKLARVIESDLKRSGYFAPIEPAAFVEKITDPDAGPRFEMWKAINAQALVTGRATREGDRITLQFRLWDVQAGEQAAGQRLSAAAKDWRRVGHMVANAVWERIIGEKGHFDTRIVYAHESGPKEARRKRIAVMDQDGANSHFLTGGQDIVFTPRFAPDNRRVAYTAQPAGGRARVVVHDLATNSREILAENTYGPRFSPDGRYLAMSRQVAGATNIVLYDIGAKRMTTLSDAVAIDTAPSFSPDGTQIAFESDRGGRSQIYVVTATGGPARRISFGEGVYSTPVWSPKGDLIAFTRRRGGAFAIGVMRPDGSGERVLAEGFHNEGPSWSPNGRFLMFFRDPGANSGSRIYMVDVTGRVEMAVPSPGFGSDPDWGPSQS